MTIIQTNNTLADVAEARSVLAGAERLHDSAAVTAAIDRIAQEVDAALRDRTPVLISVLMGGQILGARLAQRLAFPLEMDYIHATRYKGGLRGQSLDFRAFPVVDPRGRSILVVDDILDEGITLLEILDWFRKAGAESVYSAVLVEKERTRPVQVNADFIGLRVPDRYVFGCGMDYKGYWRNLDGIYAVGGAE